MNISEVKHLDRPIAAWPSKKKSFLCYEYLSVTLSCNPIACKVSKMNCFTGVF